MNHLKTSLLHTPRSLLCKRSAFTLIELLVVIAIVAILAGLGFSAVQGALQTGKKAQARNDVQQIVAAVKAYQAEYGRLPAAATGGDESSQGWFGGENNATVIRILTGQNNNNLNPRQISFLDAKTASGKKRGVDPTSGVFYDPWGNPYAIKLDTSYDGKLEYYGTGSQENVFSSALAISSGPNGQQEDPSAEDADDIVSFK
jgi:prepilin-type N-terminal cleavage/methylation domain-containing protein